MVFQKGLEAIFIYPYEPDNAERVASKFIADEHPMVRRAACLLLLRGRKHIVRERLNELIYHADPNVSRLALYFLRFIQDRAFADAELVQMKKGGRTDTAIQFALPRLYALAATEDHKTAKAVLEYLDSLPGTRSKKIQWHREHLRGLVEWSTRLPATAATTPPAPLVE
jgi:hypothetical protein